MEHIVAYGALGLAVAVLCAVALFVVFVWLIVGFVVLIRRKPAPATAAVVRVTAVEPLRPFAPTPAPVPDIVDLLVDHRSRREAEDKRKSVSEALDGIAFWSTKLPGGSPATAPTPVAQVAGTPEPAPNA